MELKDFKDVVRVMTKEEFESTIEEDIKFVEGFKNFLKHDDATRIVEHIKSVLEASLRNIIGLNMGLKNPIHPTRLSFLRILMRNESNVNI